MFYNVGTSAHDEIQARLETIRKDVDRAEEEVVLLEERIGHERQAIKRAKQLAAEYEALLK